MQKNRKFIFILLIFLGGIISAQEAQTKSSLKDILENLEDRFQIKFNYLEETIDGLELIPPSTDLSLTDTILYLKERTNLNFRVLENQVISVVPQDQYVICGYLRDKDTQEPLAFASVQGRYEATITNEEGYFELKSNSREDNIVIRYLGYRTINRAVQYFSNTNCKTIYMSPDEEYLAQIVLTNYIVKGINKLDTGEFAIDFSKFEILPGLIETDVLQAIQALPGIQSINETVSNINIRGGTHDQNMILWDDIKMYQSGHFFGLISAFNPQITEKVSIYKNGTNPSYSDGVSGTIAMETSSRVNTDFRVNAGLNLIDANVFSDIPIGKKSSLQLAARHSISDLAATPTYDNYFERIAQDTEVANNEISVQNSDQSFNFYDVSLRWLYDLSDNDRVRINFINIENELGFTENSTIDSVERSRESSISQNTLAAGLFYEHDWSDDFNSSVHVYDTEYKLEAFNANLLQSQRFLQKNEVSETGVTVRTQKQLTERLQGLVGYQFIETQVTNLDDVDVPLIRTLISEVVRTHAGFAQLRYHSKENSTRITMGIRYNYLDKFEEHIFQPRLNFYQKFLEHFSFEISGEFKHQITSQVINFQNDFLGVEKRRWQLSNNDEIPIIESKQIGSGVNYSNDSWLLTLEGYFKNVDGITSQSQGFTNQYEFVKTNGNYDIYGIDFLVRKQLKNVNFWASYSYMKNEYTFPKLPEKTFPSNLDITHSFSFGSTYSFKNLKLSGGLDWRTGKPTTLPVAGVEIVDEEINYESSNSSRLQDYLRINVSALYDLNIGNVRMRAGVSVWNLLNNENIINQYFRIGSDDTIQEFNQAALGLTPNATLRFYF